MSAIEWTDETWNPVTGCTKVSPGCANCYAEGVARRFWRGRPFGDVQCHEDRLDAPLRWRKPRRVFVNSMSDLFHEDVPNGFLDEVWNVMESADRHVFQVLTKRPERMREYVNDITACQDPCDGRITRVPPPNIWLGISVEDQKRADERIGHLLRTPASVRFLSCEPLLGPIDFDQCREGRDLYAPLLGARSSALGFKSSKPRAKYRTNRIDWVIVGGESGPKSRPCNVDWVRSIRDQCRNAGVPVFVKQLGARVIDRGAVRIADTFPPDECWPPSVCERMNAGPPRERIILKDRKGGDMDEWPEDLRVREFPK